MLFYLCYSVYVSFFYLSVFCHFLSVWAVSLDWRQIVFFHFMSCPISQVLEWKTIRKVMMSFLFFLPFCLSVSFHWFFLSIFCLSVSLCMSLPVSSLCLCMSLPVSSLCLCMSLSVYLSYSLCKRLSFYVCVFCLFCWGILRTNESKALISA